jgi:hypothetical protein
MALTPNIRNMSRLPKISDIVEMKSNPWHDTYYINRITLNLSTCFGAAKETPDGERASLIFHGITETGDACVRIKGYKTPRRALKAYTEIVEQVLTSQFGGR